MLISFAAPVAGWLSDPDLTYSPGHVHSYPAALRPGSHRRANGADRSDVQGPADLRCGFRLPSGLQQRFLHSHAGPAATPRGRTGGDEVGVDAGEFFVSRPGFSLR